MSNLIIITLKIEELQGVGGFRSPRGLTDFKKPGLNRVKREVFPGLIKSIKRFKFVVLSGGYIARLVSTTIMILGLLLLLNNYILHC